MKWNEMLRDKLKEKNKLQKKIKKNEDLNWIKKQMK
jgi:hypothetical protein